MYRFALRPWWVLSHLFCIFLAVLFISLGFWQIRRYHERLDRNEVIEARQDQAPVALGDVVSVGDDGGDEVRYRHVTLTGTYLGDTELFIDNRSNDGLPGAWVVSLLQTPDGPVVPVSRGFIGFGGGQPEPPPPPTGTVTVDGTLVPWDDGCGIRYDPADERVPVGTACINQDAVASVLDASAAPDAPLLGPLVQARATNPPDAAELVAVPPPELGEGSHRAYAAQWFIFAAIGIITYPLILRRVARDKAGEDADDGDLDDESAALLADGA